MEWLSRLQRSTPACAPAGEYTFSTGPSIKDEDREAAARAWRHLQLEGYTAAKGSNDAALAFIQTLPSLACVWLDAAASQLSKDVYSSEWNEIAGESVSAFVSLCRVSVLRDLVACDRSLLSSVVGVFLLSGHPDVLRDCMKLFASCLFAVEQAPDPAGIAAYSVIATADVVKKAAFVAENAIDPPVAHAALGFLINVICAAPDVFTKDLVAAKEARASQEADAKAAAELAAALGAPSTSATGTPVPESLLSQCLACVCATPVAVGDSVLVQLLSRLADVSLRLLDRPVALAVLLSGSSTLSAAILGESVPAESAGKRVIDALARVRSVRC
jgi:hypothetical protein